MQVSSSHFARIMQSPSSPGGRSQQLPLHPPPHQFHLPGAHFTERWGVGGGVRVSRAPAFFWICLVSFCPYVFLLTSSTSWVTSVFGAGLPPTLCFRQKKWHLPPLTCCVYPQEDRRTLFFFFTVLHKFITAVIHLFWAPSLIVSGSHVPAPVSV